MMHALLASEIPKTQRIHFNFFVCHPVCVCVCFSYGVSFLLCSWMATSSSSSSASSTSSTTRSPSAVKAEKKVKKEEKEEEEEEPATEWVCIECGDRNLTGGWCPSCPRAPMFATDIHLLPPRAAAAAAAAAEIPVEPFVRLAVPVKATCSRCACTCMLRWTCGVSDSHRFCALCRGIMRTGCAKCKAKA